MHSILVKAYGPWYPKTSQNGFVHFLSKSKKGSRTMTDIGWGGGVRKLLLGMNWGTKSYLKYMGGRVSDKRYLLFYQTANFYSC